MYIFLIYILKNSNIINSSSVNDDTKGLQMELVLIRLQKPQPTVPDIQDQSL